MRTINKILTRFLLFVVLIAAISFVLSKSAPKLYAQSCGNVCDPNNPGYSCTTVIQCPPGVPQCFCQIDVCGFPDPSCVRPTTAPTITSIPCTDECSPGQAKCEGGISFDCRLGACWKWVNTGTCGPPPPTPPPTAPPTATPTPTSTPAPPPPPAVVLFVNGLPPPPPINYGGSAFIQWHSVNTVGCFAGTNPSPFLGNPNTWSGFKPLTNMFPGETINSITQQSPPSITFAITCWNSASQFASANVTLNILPPPTPTLTPTITPTPTRNLTPTLTPTPTVTVTPPPGSNRVTGSIREDTAQDRCGGAGSGGTLFTQTSTIELARSGGLTQTQSVSSGTFTFDPLPNGNYNLSILPPGGYSVRDIFVTPTIGVTPSGSNGRSFSLNAATRVRTAVFCVTGVNAWFQTVTGDARFSTSYTNRVPLDLFASTGLPDGSLTNPGVFNSSRGTWEFGVGRPSRRGWKVEREYEKNANSRDALGTTSYSFYVSQMRKFPTLPVMRLLGPNISFDSTSASAIYIAEGNNIVLTGYVHGRGARIILLVKGNLTISTPISVPTGANNLLVIAVGKADSLSGNLTVSRAIGVPADSEERVLEGIFTAEGTITVEGLTNLDCAASPIRADKRLNVAGSLIANSLNPFSTFSPSQRGKVNINRSLCDDDARYPALKVFPRYDFLTGLTDFYKVALRRWMEEKP